MKGSKKLERLYEYSISMYNLRRDVYYKMDSKLSILIAALGVILALILPLSEYFCSVYVYALVLALLCISFGFALLTVKPYKTLTPLEINEAINEFKNESVDKRQLTIELIKGLNQSERYLTKNIFRRSFYFNTSVILLAVSIFISVAASIIKVI